MSLSRGPCERWYALLHVWSRDFSLVCIVRSLEFLLYVGFVFVIVTFQLLTLVIRILGKRVAEEVFIIIIFFT